MSWFVFRLSTNLRLTGRGRLFFHREAYASKANAEEASWDNARIANAPLDSQQLSSRLLNFAISEESVDESSAPILVEAEDFGGARRQIFRRLGGWRG